MPIEFITDEENKLYRCRFYESVSDDEIYSFWVNLYESNCRPKGYLEFLDLQELTSASVSPTSMKRVAEYRNKQHRKLGLSNQKYLIFAPTALSYGLCRMYHTYSDTSPEDVTFARTQAEVDSFLEQHNQDIIKQSKRN